MLTQFGKYTVEKKLGQGGMGAVYLALDPDLNRRVALKVITSTDPELIERFQREASAVAKLKHPNIVQVYEAGVINKQHYFTMDYIEGVSLEKLISSSKRPNMKNMVVIIRQMASALDYAHSRKVVHRDIKPANIMIDKSGRAYLTDFGLAKQLTGLDRSLTMTGTAVGTPNYMSPEQAMGRKDEIDPRSDIFSLGATLYHCLTGRLAFSGNEIYEVLNNVINNEPPSPSSVIKIIPKDLETICLKCLEKEKTKRYQSAAEIERDIKRYLEGGAITAKRTSRVTKLWIKAAKNKVASLAIAGAIVVLAVVVISLLVSSSNKRQLIARYRQEAQQVFDKDQFDQARAICNKLLVLSPGDEAIKGILKKCDKIIKAQEAKKQQEETQAKAVADKAQRALDLRVEAKAILDRANGAPTPDQKIQFAQDALKIDSTYGDAYQVIGYAYMDKRDSDKAYEYFTKAIKTTPTLAYSYYERAVITAFIRDKLEEAIPDFEMVLKYDPGSHIGYFAKGQLEYYQKRYDDALVSFNKAIELYADYAEAYNNRATTYFIKGQLDNAIADYSEAIRINQNYATSYNNRAIAYNDKGEFDRAIADCDKALSLNPQFASAYHTRGNSYNGKNDSDKAIADYSQAIKLSPEESRPYFNRGNTYHSQGELDKAIADFSQAVRLDPRYMKAYYERGNIYREGKQLDKAIADFNEVIRLDSKYAEAYENRGRAYLLKGALDKAISDFDEAIRLDSKYIEAYSNRGSAYRIKGELDKAIADYDEVIRLNPEYPEVYYNRGIIYHDKGAFDKAIAEYSQAIKFNPQYAKAYYSRGVGYDAKGEMDKAIADYSRAIILDPKYIDAYNNRGLRYSQKGETDKAMADFNEIIRLDPQNYRAYSNRGLAYFEKGDIELAIKDYTKAIELNPNYVNAYGNRSGAYGSKKDYQKAIADSEQFLKLAPNHPGAAQIKQQIEEWKKLIGK
ncbi:MAG: tetratricopeptide repeat protein [Planctomycetota bacterium]